MVRAKNDTFIGKGSVVLCPVFNLYSVEDIEQGRQFPVRCVNGGFVAYFRGDQLTPVTNFKDVEDAII